MVVIHKKNHIGMATLSIRYAYTILRRRRYSRRHAYVEYNVCIHNVIKEAKKSWTNDPFDALTLRVRNQVSVSGQGPHHVLPMYMYTDHAPTAADQFRWCRVFLNQHWLQVAQ